MESTRLSLTQSVARRPAAEPEARRAAEDRLAPKVTGRAAQLRSIEAVLDRTTQRVAKEEEEVSQRRAGGVPINDDAGLESDADLMGARAARG